MAKNKERKDPKGEGGGASIAKGEPNPGGGGGMPNPILFPNFNGLPAGNFMGNTTFNDQGQMLTQIGGPGGGMGGLLGAYGPILEALLKKKLAENQPKKPSILAAKGSSAMAPRMAPPQMAANHGERPRTELQASGYTGYANGSSQLGGAYAAGSPGPGIVASGSREVPVGTAPLGVESSVVAADPNPVRSTITPTNLAGQPGSVTQGALRNAAAAEQPWEPDLSYIQQLLAYQRLMEGSGSRLPGLEGVGGVRDLAGRASGMRAGPPIPMLR
jgi:hypothetical protein